MAHYAKIGLNNRVIAVNPVDNDIIINADKREDDDLAVRHLITTTGWPFWIKCSYNTKAGKHYTAEREESDTQEKALRKNYPSIGWTYDEDKCIWIAPVDEPSENYRESGNDTPYMINWNETNQRWQASDNYNAAEDKYWNPDTTAWVDI
jgi:hypothetical protein